MQQPGSSVLARMKDKADRRQSLRLGRAGRIPFVRGASGGAESPSQGQKRDEAHGQSRTDPPRTDPQRGSISVTRRPGGLAHRRYCRRSTIAGTAFPCHAGQVLCVAAAITVLGATRYRRGSPRRVRAVRGFLGSVPKAVTFSSSTFRRNLYYCANREFRCGRRLRYHPDNRQSLPALPPFAEPADRSCQQRAPLPSPHAKHRIASRRSGRVGSRLAEHRAAGPVLPRFWASQLPPSVAPVCPPLARHSIAVGPDSPTNCPRIRRTMLGLRIMGRFGRVQPY